MVLLGLTVRSPGAEPRAGNSPPTATETAVRNLAGALVIVGGGLLPDSVRDRYLQLAGGKKARLVVIPTASLQADRTGVYRSYNFWKSQDVASVALLHTLDRERANDPEFVKPLTEATGVWLAGGDQSRLIRAYRGTAVERELHRLLARGGVIGGTSAGASAMSAVMILGGNPLAQVGNGFGFLRDVVIDQHFQNRNRLERLLGVLVRHPTCLGIGIDEQTAVVVQGHTGTVVGNASVRVCLPGPSRDKASVQVLKAGQMIDLVTLARSVLSRLKASKAKESSVAEASAGSDPRHPAAP